MAREDLALMGLIAFLRKYAFELRHPLASESPSKVAGRLQQIARELEAEADQLEKVLAHPIRDARNEGEMY
jgi:hypothetical protein